jgi:Xaa-Pro aminopeptidase
MTISQAPQAAIDYEAVSAYRLERARAGLRRHGFAAALLFDPLNVRYTTSVGVALVWNLHVSFRWVLVPVESAPVLWDYSEAMHVARERFSGDLRPAPAWTFFGSGSNTARDAKGFATAVRAELAARGLATERLAVDRLETVAFLALLDAGIEIGDAQPALEEARAVKSPEELDIIRRNMRACDRAMEALRATIEPGRTELEMWSAYMSAALRFGAEYSETRMLSSGPRTNPWMQEVAGRVVADGDLVALDTDLIGEDGYLCDISRTYLCGNTATDEQRRLYNQAYEYVHGNLPDLRAGASFEELGQRLKKRLPPELEPLRYPFIAHGSGMGDEYPCIKWDNHHAGVMEPGMVMSVECYAGVPGGRQGVKLEEQVVITESDPEILSAAPYDDLLLG